MEVYGRYNYSHIMDVNGVYNLAITRGPHLVEIVGYTCIKNAGFHLAGKQSIARPCEKRTLLLPGFLDFLGYVFNCLASCGHLQYLSLNVHLLICQAEIYTVEYSPVR